jgi:8-oxo-dGTP pyrophosphatase MutT (NUDIX family)
MPGVPAAAPLPPIPAELPDAHGIGLALERSLRGRRPVELEEPGRRAAVLLVLYDRRQRPHLLLTKRSDTMPSHPGQISLPGGVAEPGDGSLQHTALRETEEEVGLASSTMRVVAELDDVATMVSGFIVRPFVAVVRGPVAPTLSDAEVARIMEVPLIDLLRADDALPARPAPLALRYPLDGEDVWGATARILRGFCAALRDALGVPPPRG